jgi:hypothetical protein
MTGTNHVHDEVTPMETRLLLAIIGELGTSLKGDQRDLKTDLKADIADLNTELKAD